MAHLRRTGSGLLIPANASGARELKYRCDICGEAEFFEDEERERVRHVAACVKRNEGMLREALPSNRLRAFEDPSMWDTEYEDWAKRGNWENWFREHKIQRP